MLIALLVLIAVGVLLCSDAGQEILGFLMAGAVILVLLVIGGVVIIAVVLGLGYVFG